MGIPPSRSGSSRPLSHPVTSFSLPHQALRFIFSPSAISSVVPALHLSASAVRVTSTEVSRSLRWGSCRWKERKPEEWGQCNGDSRGNGRTRGLLPHGMVSSMGTGPSAFMRFLQSPSNPGNCFGCNKLRFDIQT